MSEEFDPIHVDFLLNDQEVNKKSANIRNDITGTDASAQKSAQKVGETVKRVYDQNVKEVNEYTAAVTQSRAALRQQTAMVGRSASGFNTLNHSINQISRELPAFAVSAQIGILALSNNIPILADEIKKLKVQNEQLVASGQKGVPVWKTISKGIFSWQTLLSVGITLLTIYGREFGQWIQKLVNGGKVIDEVKDKQKALNETMQSSTYKKALQNVFELSQNFELVKEGALDADKALGDYNTTMGKVVGEAKDLNEAERLFVENSDRYIQALLYREAAKLRAQKNAEKLVEFAEKERKLEEDLAKAREGVNPSARFEVQQSQREQVQNSGERLSALRKERDEFLRVNNSIFKEFKRKELAFGFDFDASGANTKTAISNRQLLLDKIASLDKEYSRKRLSSDEEEVQALKDKFAKVRELVERFNSNPANKGAAIALGGLDETESKALNDLRYKQETKALAEAIQERRDLYRTYEEHKTQFGKDAADKRFANERLAFDSYSDYLQSKLDENREALDAVSSGSGTGGQQERVTLLQAAAEDEANMQQAKFDRLIAQLRTFQEQQLRIEESFQQKELELKAKYQGEELSKRLEVLQIQKDKELETLNEAAFKESELYEDLNARILTMTREQIKEHLALLQTALAQGFFTAADGSVFNLTQGQIGELEGLVEELRQLLRETDPLILGANKIGEALEGIGSGFRSVSDGLRELHPELSEMLDTVSDLAVAAASAAGAVASFASGDVIGGISQSLNVVGTLISIYKNHREKEQQFIQDQIDWIHQQEDGEIAVNEVLRQRNLLKAEEIDLTIQQIEATKQALEENKRALDSDIDSVMASLQEQNYISGQTTVIDRGLFGNLSVRYENQYESLAGKTYEEIEELYLSGLLEGRAQELFETLQRLKGEGVDIEQQLQDLQNQANQIFTGTTQESIADGIIQGLKDGKTAVEDFAGDMEQLLQDAILNAIKYQTLEEPLAEFYQKFADYAESEGEISEAEMEELRELYNTIVGGAIESYDQLSEILNTDLLSGNSTGLQGAIRREMTEATASELTGLYRATFDVMKRQESAIMQQLAFDKESAQKTHAIMLSNALIEDHTRETVAELRLAVTELKAIRKNTTKGSTGYDRGY